VRELGALLPDVGQGAVGHFDRDGNDPVTGKSWNSSHDTMGLQPGRAQVGPAAMGLLYCFAVN